MIAKGAIDNIDFVFSKDQRDKIKLHALCKSDMEIANQQIDDNYPLANRPIYEVLPMLRICCRKKKTVDS